ncbi:uncharacterized protein LOC118428016 [Branchiostoma floridae]|uniref:Uncharacterized protein LOC118428016 n=1 Tax=Branchiostoma floridae TaxID=7739 RepID=A0A9J7N8C1_BRAFL|nr:uncharacterized protein LOC118428016 [Branchiostoma floridae]
MKREGGSVPWTSPQQCKRSRLCVSTVGSQDSRLRLVLHFRGTSLPLTTLQTVESTPGSLKKTSLARPEVGHRKKSCLDRKVNGKIFKTPKVDSKGKSDAKKKETQQKSSSPTTSETVETAPGSLEKISLARPEVEHGKKSCLDKTINGKIFKTPQVENRSKSDAKKKPTQQKYLSLTTSQTVENTPGSLKKTSLATPEVEHGKKSFPDNQINGKICKTPKVQNRDNGDAKKRSTQQKSLLLTLSKHADTGDTERTYLGRNSTHCSQTKNIEATCRETSRQDHRNSEIARSRVQPNLV